MNYNEIKQMAKEHGLRTKDLLALAPQNDPFYVGQPAQIEKAQWFADIWKMLGFVGVENVHLRRVHYRLVSQDPLIGMSNDTPYVNTDKCWWYLLNAGKYARDLHLVDEDAFVDRRNPDPVLNVFYYDEQGADWLVEGEPDEWLDSGLELPSVPDLPELEEMAQDAVSWPQLRATGYDNARQYHVEIWAEKTTVNDVLLPICQRQEVNLITGMGEMSKTSVLNFVKRAHDSGMPARILYVSDYDPAGVGMPISVARKVEFYQQEREEYAALDIRLKPIILTAEQVREYQLPRAPVKDSDLRKANWQATHGKGATELDALEALRPGVLAGIVSEAISAYRDKRLQSKTWDIERQFQNHLDELAESVLSSGGLQSERADIDEDYGALHADFEGTRAEFSELVEPFRTKLDDYDERLATLNERAKSLHERMLEALREVEPDVEDYALPAPDVPSENGTLYASARSYLEQLEYYQSYRVGRGVIK